MVTKKRVHRRRVHHMAQVGILAPRERVELIDGEIVVMTPIGSRHSACVSCATRALIHAARRQAIVQPQDRCDWTCFTSRSRIWSFSGPEPISTRPGTDPRRRPPRHRDRTFRSPTTGIQSAYLRHVRHRRAWIADLNANVVWRYSAPERGAYQRVEEHHRGESIAPLQLPTCVVPVDAFLIGQGRADARREAPSPSRSWSPAVLSTIT